MRMMLAALLLLSLLSAACSRPWHTGPLPAAFCEAAQAGEDAGPTHWSLRDLPNLKTAPPSDRVTHAFLGTWDMLVVTTEGGEPGETERSQLRVVSPDSTARDHCPFGPCMKMRSRVAAVGAVLRRGTAFDSAAISHAFNDTGRWVVRYDSVANRAAFAVGPTVLDGGIIYEITRVSDSTFTGRWTNGGYMINTVRRGDVFTWEHEQGFFCGRRVSTSRS